MSRHWLRHVLLVDLLIAGSALAQPSTTEAQALRVVCVADSAAELQRDAVWPEGAHVTSMAQRFIVPLGSGFVVDPGRRHVVSSWHAVSTCLGDPAQLRRIGVLDAGPAGVRLRLAQQLPDRMFQDAAGRPVNLVQALCDDESRPCGADLPRGPADKPLAATERHRQLDNLLTYAPDLAVLRVDSALQAAPLALALDQQLDDQMQLLIRGVADADLAELASTAARYTGPHQISHRRPGGQPGDEIHAKLHRLAARASPALAGAAVLRGGAVVGVLSRMQPGVATSAASAASNTATNGASNAARTAYAVPVRVLAVFLDLLKVPYLTQVEPPIGVGSPGMAPPPAVGVPVMAADRQELMLGGAAALTVLAGLAFYMLARRNRRARVTAAALPLPPQRSVTRTQPSLLHATAMPTGALDAAPAVAPAPESTWVPAAALPEAHHEVHLRCSRGPLGDVVYALPMPNGGTTLFVGRNPQSCQIVFPPASDLVSAVHACLAWDAVQRHLTLRDLSSSGTWLNGERVAKGRTLALSAGDEVDLGAPGSNRFTIEADGGPSPLATEVLS